MYVYVAMCTLQYFRSQCSEEALLQSFEGFSIGSHDFFKQTMSAC